MGTDPVSTAPALVSLPRGTKRLAWGAAGSFCFPASPLLPPVPLRCFFPSPASPQPRLSPRPAAVTGSPPARLRYLPGRRPRGAAGAGRGRWRGAAAAPPPARRPGRRRCRQPPPWPRRPRPAALSPAARGRRLSTLGGGAAGRSAALIGRLEEPEAPPLSG